MFKLNRFFPAALLFTALCVPTARAADFALIYENDAAVAAGRATPAPVAEAGVLVPASTALTQSATLLIGDADGLFHGVLFRLDNDLNIAVVRRGEPVKDPLEVGRHLTRWTASSAFVGGSASVSASSVPVAASPAAVAAAGPFRATINGVGTDATVVLKNKFNKTRFTLEVVNASTAPVWAMSVRLTSDPKLSFWKDGHRSGLNEVPEAVLTYDKQAIIRPIAPGESVKVTAEAYYMKGKDYTWTVQTSAKALSGESRFAVRIE